MAVIYDRVQGKPGGPIEKAMALNPAVQADLEDRTRAMALRAELLLLEHRLEGDAAIDIEHGDIDWYVVLSDERGQKAALSIEYGRAGYVDDDGTEYGEMDGLFILAEATNLPKRRKSKVRIQRSRGGRFKK